MFRFYLDGNEVKDPLNWGEFTETLEYSEDIKGILPKYELKLTFTGGGFSYLYQKKEESGFCQLINLTIDYACLDGSYKTIINGYISISRCIFNTEKCIVECDVIDNNYGAMIYNNKSIKAKLGASNSKNGASITPAIVSRVRLFEPSTGNYIPTIDARECISIYEAFKFLIAFMTDGKVGFESDYFSGDYNGNGKPQFWVYILTGNKLRNNTANDFAQISFDELFNEVHRKYNIGFTIVDRNGIPTMKIENKNYFYSSEESGLSFKNIVDLKESFNPELLYSGVTVGGTISAYNPSIHSFIPKQFLGFDIENYYFTGNCNIDRILELNGKWIIDTNIIEELGFTNTTITEYDKDIFLIEARYFSGTYVVNAIQTILAPYTYNSDLNNASVSKRFDIYGDTLLYAGVDTMGFRAERTNYFDINWQLNSNPQSPPNTDIVHVGYNSLHYGLTKYFASSYSPKFNEDAVSPNYNTGLHYDKITGKYTVLIEGGYFFEFNAILRQFSMIQGEQMINQIFAGGYTRLAPVGTRYTIAIQRRNASNVLQETYEESYPNSLANDMSGMNSYLDGNNTFNIGNYFQCDIGDTLHPYIYVESYREYDVNNAGLTPPLFVPPINSYFYHGFQYTDLYVNVTNGSYFKCTATPTGGGVYQLGNSDEYKVSKFNFESQISNEKYSDLKEDLTKSIGVESTKKGWIRKLIRNISTGKSTVELISDLKNT